MFSRQADYAVRSVLDLTLRRTETTVFARDIARRQSIPASFLPKILTRLAAHGIVQTQRGVHGGVRLARSPETLTLLQVVEAIEGPLAAGRPGRQARAGQGLPAGPAHPVWDVIRQGLRVQMETITFAALAAGGGSPSDQPAWSDLPR